MCETPPHGSNSRPRKKLQFLPVVWLGILGREQLGKHLTLVLGPTFAPLLGSFGQAAAIWFIT